MRKIRLLTTVVALVVFAGYLFLAFTGKAPNPFWGSGGGRSGGGGSKSGEELYSSLKSSIEFPDNETDLTGKITFVAYVAGEAEEVTFEDDNAPATYQVAYIARSDDSFLLNITKQKDPLKVKTYYTVTGELNGSVYWTEDNEKTSLLDITVNSAKPFEPKEPKVNHGPEYKTDEGVLTFRGAHLSKYSFGDGIALYFDFKNTSNEDAAPPMRDLLFYQGDSDNAAETLAFDLDTIDSAAWKAKAVGIPDETYAGKTQRYYTTLKYDNKVKEDKNTLYLVRYNDNFELTDEIAISIAKDYDTWKKP